MNTKHILLVEDDPCDADMTLAALGEHNLANKVFVVHDGEEALDYLCCRGKFEKRGGGNPVVVLLDNKMPKISGLEVLKTMKGDERFKMIPVVVLTSSRQPLDLVEFYKHGVNAYVVKPVIFSEFMRAVKQLGCFWGMINEPPPPLGEEEKSTQNGEVHSHGKEEVENEIPTAHLALGR